MAKWIRGALDKPHEGALRRYIRSTYGAAGFDTKDRIRLSVLNRLVHRDDHIGHMAQFAKAMRDIQARRR